MSQPPLRVLLVDDDPATLRRLSGWLEGAGYTVAAAADAAEALAKIDAQVPDFLIADAEMPHLGGLGALPPGARAGRCPSTSTSCSWRPAPSRCKRPRARTAAPTTCSASRSPRANCWPGFAPGRRVLELERRLCQAEGVDPLTGLMTRHAFHEVLAREWYRASRYGCADGLRDDGPGLLQADQRRLWPFGRRRGAAGDRRGAVGQLPPQRLRLPLRRRGILHPAAGDRRPRRGRLGGAGPPPAGRRDHRRRRHGSPHDGQLRHRPAARRHRRPRTTRRHGRPGLALRQAVGAGLHGPLRIAHRRPRAGTGQSAEPRSALPRHRRPRRDEPAGRVLAGERVDRPGRRPLPPPPHQLRARVGRRRGGWPAWFRKRTCWRPWSPWIAGSSRSAR